MRRILVRSFFAIAFLGAFIVPFVIFGERLERFSQSLATEGVGNGFAMLAAFLLLAGDPILPTPSSIVATLVAAKVGFAEGFAVNLAGLCVACVLGYWLGRTGGWALDRMALRLPKGLIGWIARNGLIAVLLCRPVPVLAEASLVLAGAAGYPAKRLLAWACAVQVPVAVAYAFAGSGWGSGTWNTSAILAGTVGVPVAGALAVLIAMKLSHGSTAGSKSRNDELATSPSDASG